MSVDFETQANAGIAQSQFWRLGRSDPKAIGKAAISYANALRRQRMHRRKLMLLHAQMYADGPTLGLGPYEYMMWDETGETLRMNVVKAVVDAYVTQIVQSNPKPMVLTNGADWATRRKAKGMTKWWEAKAGEADWRHTVDTPCARDCATFGTAFVKVAIENEDDPECADVMSERVFPFQVLANDVECQNFAHLRTLGQEKYYDRYQLSEMFPDARSKIKDSPRHSEGDDVWQPHDTTASDLILVTELWHLPTTPKSKDGMRVLVLPDGNLLAPVQKWEDKRFPIFPLWRSHPSMGIWGQSIPWELRGIQIAINETLEDIQEALRTMARPKWMVPFGSEIVDDMIDDDLGTIMKYAGTTPPTVYAPSVIPPEQFKFLWDLWSKAFELVGIAAAGGAGNVPQGLSGSGSSIRAWNEVQGGRMYEASELRENFTTEWGKRAFDCGKRVADIRPDYASNYRRNKQSVVEVVKFKDVSCDDYDVGVYPASRLSQFPGQRLAQLDELFGKGIIDAKEYRAMLDFSDLENESNLANAPRDLTDKLIERFLDAKDPTDPEVYMNPDPTWDLQFMKQRFQYASVMATLDEAPDENIKLLTNFMSACQYWIDKATKPQVPPAMPGGPMAPPPDPSMGMAPPPPMDAPMPGAPPAPPMGNA